jgi:hypothetical protein
MALAALLLLSQTGCALHPRVETLGPGRYAVLNERAARQPAHVLMRDGTQVGARGLILGDETATWTDADTGRPVSAPVTEVAEVRLRNNTGRGAAIGGTWGFLIGTAIGALLGLASGGGDQGGVETNPLGDAMLAGIVTGAAGWVIGLPIGAIRGTDDIYRLPPSPQGTPNRLLDGGGARP